MFWCWWSFLKLCFGPKSRPFTVFVCSGMVSGFRRFSSSHWMCSVRATKSFNARYCVVLVIFHSIFFRGLSLSLSFVSFHKLAFSASHLCWPLSLGVVSVTLCTCVCVLCICAIVCIIQIKIWSFRHRPRARSYLKQEIQSPLESKLKTKAKKQKPNRPKLENNCRRFCLN